MQQTGKMAASLLPFPKEAHFWGVFLALLIRKEAVFPLLKSELPQGLALANGMWQSAAYGGSGVSIWEV